MSSPQLLNRYQFSTNNLITGIHKTDSGYFITCIVGGIFFTSSLLEMNETNVLQNYDSSSYFHRSFTYMDKLHIIVDGLGEVRIIRCTADENNILSMD